MTTAAPSSARASFGRRLSGAGGALCAFVLHEELLAFQEHSQLILAEFSVPDIGSDAVASRIDNLADLLQSDPTLVLTGNVFDVCRTLIKYFDDLTPGHTHKFADIILTAFEEAVRATKMDLDENANHNFETDRVLTEMYAFLCFCLVERGEARWKVASMDSAGGSAASKAAKPKARSKAAGRATDAAPETWDWPSQRERVVAVLEQLAALALDRIVLAASERDVLVNIICRCTGLILEDPKAAKKESIRSALIDTLCLVATRHENQAKTGGLHSRIQDYLREDHLADFVAELLNAMVANYDNMPFFELVVGDVAERQFFEKDLKPAKTVARFIVRLSEIRPRELMRCMAQLQSQFDSESYTIRCAMIESIGNIIHIYLVNDSSEGAAKTLHRFYDILIERFRDVNHYARTKVLQVLARLSERRPDAPAVTDIPLETRHRLVALTIGRLRDKASIVRKNAIKLLTKFVETSPFIAIEEDQGRLSLAYFETRRANLVEIIRAKYPAETMDDIVAVDGRSESGATTPRKTPRKKVRRQRDNDDDVSESDSNTEMPDAVDEEMVDADAPDTANVNTGDEEDDDEAGATPAVFVTDVELQRLRVILKYYNDGIQFIRQVSGAVPILCDVLSSSIKTEVVESMRFFVVSFRHEMESSWEGVRRMVHKIWDKDTTDNEAGSIREHVIKCYESLFLDPPEGPRPVAEVIAENLIGLTQRMTFAELTSLEQLISLMAHSDRLNMDAVGLLWGVFSARGKTAVVDSSAGHAVSASSVPISVSARREGALMVLGMIGKARKEILIQNLDRIVRDGLGRPGTGTVTNQSSRDGGGRMPSLSLARHACLALQHAAADKREKGAIARRFVRLSVRHPMFIRLVELVCSAVPSSSMDHGASVATTEPVSVDDDWFPFCEQAVNTVYALAEHPDKIAGVMVRRLARDVFDVVKRGNKASNVSQTVDDDDGRGGGGGRRDRASGGADLFGSIGSRVSGVGLDDDGDVDMSMDEDQQQEQRPDAAATLGDPAAADPASVPNAIRLAQLVFLVGHVAIRQIVHLESIEAEWKRRRNTEEVNRANGGNGNTTGVFGGQAGSGSLDQVTGSAEDEFVDRVANVRERELLFSHRSLLSVFGPIVAHVCMHPRAFPHPVLQTMASLSLCKLMCVSGRFCESHLPLLFSVLERSNNPIVRSNTVIGLGDMAIAFNALIDLHIGRLYARLSDPSTAVKKDALMVLTFLVLNGMVKVKGQLSEMAKCLEDPCPRLRDLARLFFTELSTKDNAIYNNLPDMISTLSAIPDESQYRSIMRFLFDFIKRERQGESIIDKLVVRFKTADMDSPRQWTDVAYCLSLLPFGSEKGFRKLVEALPVYADKLHVDGVYRYIGDIVRKVKKSSFGNSGASNGGGGGVPASGTGGGGGNVRSNAELRSTAEAFEKTLEEARARCLESHEAVVRAERDKTQMVLPRVSAIHAAVRRGRDRMGDDQDEGDREDRVECEDDRDSLVGDGDGGSGGGVAVVAPAAEPVVGGRRSGESRGKNVSAKAGNMRGGRAASGKQGGAGRRRYLRGRGKHSDDDDDDDEEEEDEDDDDGSDEESDELVLGIVDKTAAVARGSSTPVNAKGRHGRAAGRLRLSISGGRRPGASTAASRRAMVDDSDEE